MQGQGSNKRRCWAGLRLPVGVGAALVVTMCGWAGAAGGGKGHETLPWSLRGVRDSLRAGDHSGMWFFQALMVLAAGVLVLLILRTVRRGPRREQVDRPINKPRRLFRELLGELELDAAEKRLLRRMTSGARLKHPAMAVLSPGLLEWTRRLWLAEKGERVVDGHTNQRVDGIAVKLFGHAARATISGPENDRGD